MTLQDAIEQVIREARRPLKSSEIAHEINSRKLYIKADKTKVTPSQIAARISKYPDLFKIDEQGISLYDIALLPYRDFTFRMTSLLHRISPADNIKVHDLVASLLILIYFQRHNVPISVQQGRCKEGLKNAFDNLTFSEPKLLDRFSHVFNFISGSISEYEAEQILRLIYDYKFHLQPIPSQEEFSSFFNDVVNAYSWKTNFRGGESSTPKLITQLMCSLYSLREGAIVFDPFAGRASLLIEFLKQHRIFIKEILAGDINPSSVNVGSLNIYATGFKNFEYKQRNAFTEWKGKLSADLIISNPPFGLKMEEFGYNYDWQIIPTKDITLNAIQLAIHHADHDGKIVMVLPESVLFGTRKEQLFIRELLVNQDLLHGVILLPKNSFKPYTAASTTLLMIDKSRTSKSTGVFFYDASNVPVNDFKKEIKDIVSAFHSETSKKEKARWVTSDEIIRHEYDLTVKKYLLQSFVGEEYVTLKSMTRGYFTGNHVSADNINKSEGVPYIQVGDLVDGEGLESIKRNNVKSFISDIELVSSSIRKIPPGSILLAKVGTRLKPTLFEEQFQAVASSNIIVLEPASGVLVEYLISQLQSEYVQKQIEVIRRYNAIPNFNLRELLDIQIKKLSLEQQHQYVTSYYSRKIADIEKAETKNKEDDLYNLISRIKHEVKQPVSSIGIDIVVLEDYLKDREANKQLIFLDDYAIAPLEGQSDDDIEKTKVSNIIARIKASVLEAQETLQKAEETLNIGKGVLKAEPIEIKNFIETSVRPLYANTNCVIELHGKEHIINADKYQLKIIFKHLIENALKWGFTSDKPKEQNIIRIELKLESLRSFLEIVVMNNGKPFSNGFNRAFFETRGVTTDRNNGSGFGGYHIKRIIENHKGEFQIADDEEVQFTDFKVKFKIYLPLNL